MSDIVFVYIDKKKIIHEIEFEPSGEFLDYDLIMIPREKASEIINLYERWKQNSNVKKNVFVLVNTPFECSVKKTTYVYYHFKEKTIRAITPRKQENLDNDKTLLSGLIVVDGLITEFINGKTNMLNFTVDDSGDFLVLNEIERENVKFNVVDNNLLIEDFSIGEKTTDETAIEITYKNKKLLIKKLRKIENRIFTLFFINSHDKTNLIETISFSFGDDELIIISLDIKEDFFIISEYKKNMVFKKEKSGK